MFLKIKKWPRLKKYTKNTQRKIIRELKGKLKMHPLAHPNFRNEETNTPRRLVIYTRSHG